MTGLEDGLLPAVVLPPCRCWRCSSSLRSLRRAAAAAAPTRKANDAYASGVCSAIGTWVQQIKSITSSGFTGGISKATLDSKIAQAETATKTLAKQIKAVPPPNTSDGQAAKAQVDQFSSDAASTASTAQTAVASIPADASATTVAVALLPLAPQVKSLVTTAQTTITSLQTAKNSLASAFKSADSCQSLGG